MAETPLADCYAGGVSWCTSMSAPAEGTDVKRQLSLSVMEDDQGYLTLMAIMNDRCDQEYVHEAVSLVQLDELPASGLSAWLKVAAHAMTDVLGEGGEVREVLMESITEGRTECDAGN